ncbi:universal stress protein [Blastococcus xanthinilyticus]|uniref:Nucleotide-binding universal stress UspA family protein n=1 Tax=Blastococcus xanthinilyticus TaxID=1564164 RepID=A0A5S5D0Q2_9ACTN|nr:universal stress protein [Blastococcus xanthinilyticus]TYP88924.1 nucleotide-binding universal stress UspA family protein [Blastococcus xanthinilyticus]
MTVLVGYLPTPEGEAAFTAALQEARRRSEPLVVLNSARGGAPVSVEVAPDDAIAQITARAAADGVQLDLRQEEHSGDAADEVLRVARDVDASVIVIGLRRRSPVGKLLMGSSAQRILLDADRPVLAVKP